MCIEDQDSFLHLKAGDFVHVSRIKKEEGEREAALALIGLFENPLEPLQPPTTLDQS